MTTTLNHLRRLLALRAGGTPPADTATLDALGLDSLDAVSLSLDLEEALSREIRIELDLTLPLPALAEAIDTALYPAGLPHA